MKTTRIVLSMMLVLTTLVAAESALAQRHGPRVVVGIGIGAPFPYSYPYYYRPYPYYYYPPYAYYPAPVVVQQQPVYIEQNAPQPQAQPQASSGYWYFCAEPNGYYPYVRECPTGWQRVAPQPSN